MTFLSLDHRAVQLLGGMVPVAPESTSLSKFGLPTWFAMLTLGHYPQAKVGFGRRRKGE